MVAPSQRDVAIPVNKGCIRGSAWLPPTKPYPLVLLAPGGNGRRGSNGKSRVFDHIAALLAENGIGAFIFNARGQGIAKFEDDDGVHNEHSDGKFTILNFVEDIRSIIDAVARGSIEAFAGCGASRFGLFGQCGGGIACLKAAVGNARVASVATFGACPDYKKFYDQEWIREEVRRQRTGSEKAVDIDFDEEFRLRRTGEYEMAAALPHITQPVLIMNGTNDVLEHYCYRFMDEMSKTVRWLGFAGKSVRVAFVLLKGAKHSPPPREPETGASRNFYSLVLSWFQDTLSDADG